MNVNKQMDDCKRGFVGVSANIAVTAVLPLNIASIRFQPLHATSLALMPLPPRPDLGRNRVEIKSRNVVMPSDASDAADPAGPGSSRSGFSRSGLVGGGWRCGWMD